jgi:hypothetical protein
MKNVKVLKDLQPEAVVAFLQDVECPAQDVEVRATVDHKNNDANDKTWQGYMVFFESINRVVPISAGLLLTAAEEAKRKDVFTVSDDGHELVCNHFGIQEGKIVFK